MPIEYLQNFQRWDFFSPLDLKLHMVDASNTPFITYDNGLPCFEANMYMHQLLLESKSRRVDGGTLKTYAKLVHHLVRFCYRNKVKFSKLTNAEFRLFVQNLQNETNNKGEKLRQNNHVVEISRRCLFFLRFISNFHDLKNFIGEGKENAIIVKIIKIKVELEGSRYVEREFIDHQSIPSKDAEKHRLPVSEKDFLKVWNFVSSQKNRDKRLRDIALYQSLEQLGCRVTELHLIKVSDIENAIKLGNNPSLVLTTLKRKDHKVRRHVPITSALLTDIKLYMNKVRRKIIKNKLGVKNDHGYLFVSLTTGKPLQSYTLTRYMNIWKKLLKIEGELFPHLYRHAYITDKFKELFLEDESLKTPNVY